MRIISASLDSGPSGSVLYLEFSFPVRHRECGGIGGREEMVGCPSLGLMGDETSPIRLSLSAKSVFGPHSHCSCLGTFQIFICPCFFFFPCAIYYAFCVFGSGLLSCRRKPSNRIIQECTCHNVWCKRTLRNCIWDAGEPLVPFVTPPPLQALLYLGSVCDGSMPTELDQEF